MLHRFALALGIFLHVDAALAMDEHFGEDGQSVHDRRSDAVVSHPRIVGLRDLRRRR